MIIIAVVLSGIACIIGVLNLIVTINKKTDGNIAIGKGNITQHNIRRL